MMEFQIKYVDRPSDSSLGNPNSRHAILVAPPGQSTWSYSAVVATCNALLAMEKVTLPSFGRETIGADELTNMLIEYFFAAQEAKGNEVASLVEQVFDELPGFVNDDLTVEWPCSYGLRGLSDLSPVFAGFDLKIFNGTVIDPSRNDELAQCLRGKGREELEQQLIHSQGRHRQGRVEAMLRLGKCSAGMSTGEAYRPLTPFGYRMLQQNVEEGGICILVFGGRFFTLLKHSRELYVLVTDTALTWDERVVWQRLDHIYDGVDEFMVGPNFLSVKVTDEIEDFTVDLDWNNGNNKFSNESIREYQVLGYNADVGSSSGNRQMIEEQRLAFERMPRPDGDGSDGLELNTSDADEQAQGMSDAEYAMLLQEEEERNLRAQPPPLVQQSDLAAALAESLRSTGVVSGGQYGQESTRASPQSDQTKRWNLDLVIALEVRHEYFLKRGEDWESWYRGITTIRACQEDLYHSTQLPLSLESKVLFSCSKIMSNNEKIIPERMRKAAKKIEIEEFLTRPEEHARLANLLQNYGPADEACERIGASSARAVSDVDDYERDSDDNIPDLVDNAFDNEVAQPPIPAMTPTVRWSKPAPLPRNKENPPTAVDSKEFAVQTARMATVPPVMYLTDDDVPSNPNPLSDIEQALELTSQASSSSAATVLQSIWRGHAARKNCTEQRLIVFSSSTTIQASWRSYSIRRNIRHNAAATAIQAAWRSYSVRRDVKRKRNAAATSIQAPTRRFLEEKRYEEKKQAATRLAAFSRGLLARQYFLRILSTIKINAIVRGFLARRRYGDAIRFGFEEWKHVNELWGPVRLCVSRANASSAGLFSWNNIKKRTFDINQADERDEEDHETTSRVDAAREGVASDDDNDENAEESANDATEHDTAAVSAKTVVRHLPSEECDRLPLDAYDNIMLTRSVIKWFNRADSVYKGFFLRRMRQFANGEYERSQKLRKNLTNCKHIIYEAYLEQKVAQRILFTECRTKDDEGNVTTSILVWYVAKHDYVPRYMCQIDKAEARMNDQFTASASQLIDENRGSDNDDDDNEDQFDGADAMVLSNDTILLDPLANTPLKIHQLNSTEIDKLELEKWTPPFRLTTEEKKIVQTPGTVLVLGRSGTGKTVCIVNRMVFDATHLTRDGDSLLKQLFISRSSKIKNLVQKLVLDVIEDPPNVERAFSSYERIIRDCNAALTNFGLPTSVPAMEQPKLQQNFSGFKEEFFKRVKKDLKVKLSALVVWTQIRSFIKGSIEAVTHGRPLTLTEYLTLGAKYCRLNPDQRREAYTVYGKYASWLESNNYYDSCDRTVDLLNRIRQMSIEDRINNNIRFDIIYVDECQDFTSSDFALFWVLCQGGGNLFLCGDTAQSVEQGISFRFEEVKRVFYEMNMRETSGVPSSPLSIHINFRSHAGVLEVAAAVLKILHDAFPGAANKLKEDKGLFKGPRPCIMSRKEEKFLGCEAFLGVLEKNPHLVLLTPDDNVAALQKQLLPVADNLVVGTLGICEAKGLDFDEVCIVDFFCSSPTQLGKAWKELFKNSMDMTLQDKFPELEMRLKLLYTAITRCRHRLFFVETKQSSVAESFSRWILKRDLAEKQGVADLSLELKSADEYRSLGVEYALNAESQDSAQEAESWFDRASMCFKHAGDEHLMVKAQSHAMIRKKAAVAFDEEWTDLRNDVPYLVIECLEEGGFVEEALDLCERFRDLCSMKDRHLKDAVDVVIEGLKSTTDRVLT